MTTPTASPAFDRAMRFLASFTDYEQKAADKLRRESLDLDRMRLFADSFGNPHERLRIAHVAGSKGKGSTTNFIESLLRAHGLRTGRFLSPHLEHVTERIAVDGRPLSAEAFARRVESLRSYVEPLRERDPVQLPSFFESVTLMAFLEFAEREVDAAAVEVGLGGRLDATNIVDPVVSVITTIDLEHTRVLGKTRAQIAREKAGIMKPGRPVIVGVPRASEEGRALAESAHRRQSPASWLGSDVRLLSRTRDESGATTFDAEVDGRAFRGLRIEVLGDHQLDNALLALAALVRMEDGGCLELSEECLRHGFERARQPGRLECFPPSADRRLVFAGPVLLDSAHTPGSMSALAAAVDRWYPVRRPTLLFGLLRDKRIIACLRPLAPLFRRVVVLAPSTPRAVPAADLAREVSRVFAEGTHVRTIDSMAELDPRLDELDADGLVVAGSIYLAGEVRSWLVPPAGAGADEAV